MITLTFADGCGVQVGAPAPELGKDVDKVLQVKDPHSGILAIIPLTEPSCKLLAEALTRSNKIATLPSGLTLPGLDRLDPNGRKH